MLEKNKFISTYIFVSWIIIIKSCVSEVELIFLLFVKGEIKSFLEFILV